MDGEAFQSFYNQLFKKRSRIRRLRSSLLWIVKTTVTICIPNVPESTSVHFFHMHLFPISTFQVSTLSEEVEVQSSYAQSERVPELKASFYGVCGVAVVCGVVECVRIRGRLPKELSRLTALMRVLPFSCPYLSSYNKLGG